MKIIFFIATFLAIGRVKADVSDECINETVALDQNNILFAVARIALLATGKASAEDCVASNAIECEIDLSYESTEFQSNCLKAGGQTTSAPVEMECSGEGGDVTFTAEVPICGGLSCDLSIGSDFVEGAVEEYGNKLEDAIADNGYECDDAEVLSPAAATSPAAIVYAMGIASVFSLYFV